MLSGDDKLSVWCNVIAEAHANATSSVPVELAQIRTYCSGVLSAYEADGSECEDFSRELAATDLARIISHAISAAKVMGVDIESALDNLSSSMRRMREREATASGNPPPPRVYRPVGADAPVWKELADLSIKV